MLGDANVITNFTATTDGDSLDLRLLRSGVASEDRGGLGDYIDFGFGGGDTTLTVDADGAGGSSATAGITLAGTDRSSLGASDTEIIDTMLAQGNLDAV